MTGKGTALAYFALNFERRLVAFKRVFGNSEAEARPAERSRATCIDTIEAFGQSWDVFRSDTDTCVPHRHMSPRFVGPPANVNCTRDGCVFHRVGHQIAEHRRQLVFGA